MAFQTGGQGRDYKQTNSEGMILLVPRKDEKEFGSQQYKRCPIPSSLTF